MPFCWKCGKNAGSNAYCGGCGTEITTSATTKDKVYCNDKGCDDTGTFTYHGKSCPLNPKYKKNTYDYEYP